MTQEEFLGIRMDKNLKKQLMRYAIMENKHISEVARYALKKFIEDQIALDMQKNS